MSLSSEVVGRVDERARRTHSTRSAVMEEWLQAGERLAAEGALAAEVESYYRSMTPEERAESDAIAAASSRAARALDIDEEPVKVKPRRRK
ncbi:MAG TPA: ribbon-helix-helix protein, CopG family [Myxococcales bacterium]